jgi:hypothetical protein
MYPETTIVWLRDKQGDFPHAEFSGDTDTATMGWMSFTARSGNEVVLAYLTGDEWRSEEAGIAAALDRIHRETSREDLVHIRVWFEKVGPSGKGMSFQEFLKVYRPDRAHYSSRSGSEEATRVREESIDKFISSGGIVTVSSPNKSLERTREG